MDAIVRLQTSGAVKYVQAGEIEARVFHQLHDQRHIGLLEAEHGEFFMRLPQGQILARKRDVPLPNFVLDVAGRFIRVHAQPESSSKSWCNASAFPSLPPARVKPAFSPPVTR